MALGCKVWVTHYGASGITLRMLMSKLHVNTRSLAKRSGLSIDNNLNNKLNTVLRNLDELSTQVNHDSEKYRFIQPVVGVFTYNELVENGMVNLGRRCYNETKQHVTQHGMAKKELLMGRPVCFYGWVVFF